MDIKTEKKIISEYKKGKSSLQIVDIVGLSKPTILKVLRKHNIVRKRDRCSKLKIEEKNNFFYSYRTCPKCNESIITKSKDKVICCRNHYRKISEGVLCKPCSLELQKGNGNPFYGKKHSDKSKKEISKSRKGKGVGEKNSMSNPEWKKKASQNLKKKWQSGDLEDVRKRMSEQMKKTIKLGKIKSFNSSKKEKQINSYIQNLGFNTIQSYRIDTKICDIFIPSLNLIIEYFGDYWHCNPQKYNSNYFNKKKSLFAEQIWKYDKTKVDLIKSLGYNLEVIWESDLKYNNDKILKILDKYDTKSNFAPERS